MQRLKVAVGTAGHILLDYFELVLAAALAIVVTGLAFAGEITTKQLIQATIALLVALAISVIRERRERKAQGDRLEKNLMIARADKPWQVLDEQLVWDVSAPDGSYAQATTTKELQFMQDEVLSVYEYRYNPSGTVLRHECKGGARGEPMTDLPIIQRDFPGPGSRIYRIISLQRVWRRGEIMTFESERELGDSFLSADERVSKEISVPTARVSMRVIWPPGRELKGLWLERGEGPPLNVLGRLKRAPGARISYDEVIQDPKVGERIIVRWNW
ncbi:MAG TPA: hypothetical protein VG053_01580 [Solirubrobacteraceae bacterium]|jgi:hypothetical protein|nr:hypothetical protein [Solirubrobacteraceae bacterium]